MVGFRLWKVPGWLISIQPLSWTSPIVVEYSLFITRDYSIQKRIVLVAQKQTRTDLEMWQILSIIRTFKSWGTHFSSFLNFPIRFKPSKIPWEVTPSSSAIPRTVCDGSVFTLALKSSFWITVGLPLWGSSKLKSPERNFANQRRTVRTLTLSLSNARLIFRAVSAALWFNLDF